MFVLTETGDYINFNPKTDSLLNIVTTNDIKVPLSFRSYECSDMYEEYLKSNHNYCKSSVNILRQTGAKIKIYSISEKFNDVYIGGKIVKEFGDIFIKKLLQVSFINPENNFIWDVTKEYPTEQFSSFKKTMLDKLDNNKKE